MKKIKLFQTFKSQPRSKESWLMAAPLLLVVFFIILIILGLFYLKNIEERKNQAMIYREVPLINQKIEWHFNNNIEEAKRLLQNMTIFSYDKEGLKIAFEDFKKKHSEIQAIYYLSTKQELIWRLPYTFAKFDDIFSPDEGQPSGLAHSHTKQERSFILKLDDYYIVHQLPVLSDGDVIGFVMLLYPTSNILKNWISPDILENYRLQLVTRQNEIIADSQLPLKKMHLSDGTTSVILPSFTHVEHQQLLNILPKDLTIKAFRYDMQDDWLSYLFWSVIFVLVILIFFSIWLINKHLQKSEKTQQKLAHEITFRQALCDSALIGIFALDINKRVTYVNPALCEMTGFQKDELLTQIMPLPFWYFDTEYEYIDQMIFDTKEVRFSQGIERRLQGKNGLFFYGRLYISALMQNDKQTGWLITLLDHTEAKRAKEELDIANRRFMIVLENLDLAVSIIIPQTRELLFVNRYYIQNFGKQLNTHLELAQNHHNINELTALDWLTTTLPNFKSQQFYEVFLTQSNRWFSVKKQPIQWADGRLAQMIIALDITEFKIVEQQNRLNESRWHFSNRLSNLGEMATSFAHELNQPLGAIYNYCHGALMRLNQLEQKQKENPNLVLHAEIANIVKALEKSTTQAIKAGDILHKLRNFVKKDALEKKSENILDILNDALILIELSFPKQAKVEIDAPADLPMVWVDRVLIEQVFVNLIKNAIESNMQADKIQQQNIQEMQKQIKLEEESQAQKNDAKLHNLINKARIPMHLPKRHVKVKIFKEAQKMHIWITDQGLGISEEAQSKLFDAFYTTKAEGVGIGLKICRSIIENHQGRLSAENNQHKFSTLSQSQYKAMYEGATFKIQIPIENI